MTSPQSQSSCNYYAHNSLFTRTERDLQDMARFCTNADKTVYGPNPNPNEKATHSTNQYKNLGSAYEPHIMNDCTYRWDNDYMAWENRINKSGKGLK